MLYVEYALCVTYAVYEVCAAAYGIYMVSAIHAVCVVYAASGIYAVSAVCAVCAIYAIYASTAAQAVYAVCAASSTHKICNIISSIFTNVRSIFIDFVNFHSFL